MNTRSFNRTFWVALLLVSPTKPCFAWYDHAALMANVQKRLEQECTPPIDGITWDTPLPTERESPTSRYSTVANLLLLQPSAGATLPSLGARTLHDLLRLGAEDPDHGIDSDLPDSADLNEDRPYMGGTRGPSSQGFRHSFWAGWNWRKPIPTFQSPKRALGQAPDRIELLANEARSLFRKGDLLWGGRILGWAIHYLQDLTQPFHTVEFPSLAMFPLRSLFIWPPTEAFSSLLKESVRVTTNYHWAYEGYVRNALLDPIANPFKGCFTVSEGSFLVASPRELALAVTERSITRAPRMGAALVALVGTHLKSAGVSVPLNPGQIDVNDLLKNPERAEARNRLNTVTCESLRTATDATIWITRWAFAR